jgi:two-component sensor histidine kinase
MRMDTWTVEYKVTVPLANEVPRQVRADLETRWGATLDRPLLDEVKMMASELVGNALVHSGRPMGDPLTLSIKITDDVLRLEVIDQGPGVEHLTPRQTFPASGLQCVDLLSDRWGGKHENSFHVWFEIDVTPGTTITRTEH